MSPREDADEGAPRPRVQSAARTVTILMAVAQSDRGLTTKEISEQVGISRQAVYHLLHTLTETGMLARGSDGRIILGLNVGSLVAGFDRQLSPSERLAPLVRRLAQETDETSYAAGWHLGEITVHAVSRGSNPVQAAETPLGFTGLAHARASGKLLLAMMHAQERKRYLGSHPLEPVTEHTLIDARAFEKEMEIIRERGYATDHEELAEGVCCAAVPLDGGRSPYVLAVSAPKSRFDENFEHNLAILRKIAEVSFIELLKS